MTTDIVQKAAAALQAAYKAEPAVFNMLFLNKAGF